MKNQEENKLSGSYYTPHKTVQFMRKYLEKEHKLYGNMLEPSVGDGRFLEVFEQGGIIRKLVGVELNRKKVEHLRNNGYSGRIEIVESDFLDFAIKTKEKYQLIVGNPPYINIKNMENNSKEKAKRICECFQLSKSLMKNLWVAFLLASVSCLKKGGSYIFCASTRVSSGSICRKD